MLFACGTQKNELNDRHLLTENSQVENFDIFIEKFSNDIHFQLSRINFPLKECQYIGQYASPCSEITIKNWTHSKLNDSTKFELRKFKANDNHDFELNNHQRVISRIESDANNCLNYYFSLNDKKWNLTQILRCE